MRRQGDASATPPTSVELSEISVHFGDRLVLEKIDLAVDAGEWLGVIGPNGAGKSTLLRAIAGLVESEGRIVFGSGILRPAGRKASQLVAFLPQRPELPSSMRVSDYVLLGRSPHISLFGSEQVHDQQVAADVIERLNLGTLCSRPLGELSGGEAQRVVLARALAQGAPVLCLDEPSTALDLGQGQRVLELVDELRRERKLTVISAMHDLGMISQYADRLAVVVEGRLIVTGTSKAVLTREAISEYYGASVRLIEDDSGAIVVVPIRPRRIQATASIEDAGRSGLEPA